MLTRGDLHGYQETALAHVINNKNSMLILDMGLGKTVTSLTAVSMLLKTWEIKKPLIIAPKLVTEQTWIAEIQEWAHLENLTISRIIGTEAERIAAIRTKADIYAISRDNITWLVEYWKRKWPYDMGIIDESSSFKSHTSNRFKSVKRIRAFFERMILLTGTPTPNGLMDLWAQVYLVDGGLRLEKTIGAFRQRYFQRIYKGDHIKEYVLWPGAAEQIYAKISDIAISMKAADWLKLKPRVDTVTRINLPSIFKYKKFEKDKILEILSEDITISSVNAAGLYNKLLQYCNGAVYDEDKVYHVVNNTKLDQLEEDIEALNGKPVIVFYQFQSDIARILKRIPGAVKLKGTAQIDAWNKGKIPVLVAHAASTGHGLNLQKGGYNLIWFGLPWSLELYLQAVARVDRQGQKHSVVNKVLITKGTIEELVWERLKEKGVNQDKLIEYLRWYAEKIAA